MKSELSNILSKLKAGELNNPAILEEIEQDNNHDIAIIGIALNLPYAKSMDELLNIFSNGIDCIGELPKERKTDVIKNLQYKDLTSENYDFFKAAFLEEIDKFDYPFFKISKTEAECMDPLQKIFLETAWQAFEDAGYSKRQLKGQNAGVFLAHPHPTNYYERIPEIAPELMVLAGPGNISSIIASRISYLLDLSGISCTIDTACSSALTSVHLACQALKNDECEMALVGGINLLLEPVRYKNHPVPDIASANGRAKTFSDDADGTGQGEGCIAIVLKPLEKAIKDNDHIYARVKASACNNDGASIGITAPNALAQKKVILQALHHAKINPESIGYIEAHGTGTKLGDPIELEGITDAFRSYTKKSNYCAIGSAKTNYGHLDSAAGLLGIVKCILSLQQKQIFPNINFDFPNRNIDFINSPVYLANRIEDWDNKNQLPLRCGISSFGLSGTNVHVILEEYEEKNNYNHNSSNQNSYFLLPLSAKTEVSLMQNMMKWRAFIAKRSEINLRDVCYTAQTARDHYRYRLAIVFCNQEQLLKKLNNITKYGLLHIPEDGIYYGYVNENLSFSSNENINMNTLAEKYVQGYDISWESFYLKDVGNKVSLPAYQFEKRRCWLEMAQSKQEKISPQGQEKIENSLIIHQLKKFVAELFAGNEWEIDETVSFFELGIDSITIVQLKQHLQNTYNLNISTNVLFEDLNTIFKLSGYISKHYISDMIMDQSRPIPPAVVPSEIPDDIDELKQMIRQQMDLMSRQLSLLEARIHTNAPLITNTKDVSIPDFKVSTVAISKEDPDRLLQKFIIKANLSLTENQTQYLKQLVSRYVGKMALSQELAQKYRPVWANGRMVQGFTQEWKQLIFPIFSEKSQGSRIWDVDQNEYIDFAMGFGVNLFGYSHPEITAAMVSQLEDGIVLGSMVPIAGEVAALLAEITGVERVAFCNSGTEAVMNAVRIARAATGRDKIIIFKDSFHGTFDGIYASQNIADKRKESIPLSLGTTMQMVSDVIIADYADEETFDLIHHHAHELAAILVEPVQSRNPALQPKVFLQRLREITKKYEIALIFDEIITGFRIHSGGAQAYFDIQADIVTYGKILGGGMPIGVFAGKAKFMDRVDGGFWNYKDETGPNGFLAHTGGTFCHHPLAMAAARKTLSMINERGNTLQDKLNKKTSLMANFCNTFFKNNKIPLEIAFFGSLFIFRTNEEPNLLRFLFYQLIEKGFYLWEGATCFLSEAHTDYEIAAFIHAMIESCMELEQAGCFHFYIKQPLLDISTIQAILFTTKGSALNGVELISHKQDRHLAIQLFQENSNIEAIYPLSPMQEIMLAQNISFKGTGNDISFLHYQLRGTIRVEKFQVMCQDIIDSHDIFRTAFMWRKVKQPLQIVYKKLTVLFEYKDFSHADSDTKSHYQQYLKEEEKNGFHVMQPPLIKMILLKKGEQEFEFLLKYQTSLFDGWSSALLFKEMMGKYHDLTMLPPSDSEKKVKFLDYIKWMNYVSPKDSMNYWKEEFLGFAVNSAENSKILKKAMDPNTCSIQLSEGEICSIKQFTKHHQITDYTLFQGAWAMMHCQKENIKDIILSTVCSGRPADIEGLGAVIGLFSNVLPLRVHDLESNNRLQWLKKLQSKILNLNAHQFVTLSQISDWTNIPTYVFQEAIYSKTLLYLNYPQADSNQKMEFSSKLLEERSYVNVPLRIYIEPDQNFKIVAQYNQNVYDKNEISALLRTYKETVFSFVYDRNIDQTIVNEDDKNEKRSKAF